MLINPQNQLKLLDFFHLTFYQVLNLTRALKDVQGEISSTNGRLRKLEKSLENQAEGLNEFLSLTPTERSECSSMTLGQNPVVSRAVFPIFGNFPKFY